MLTDGGAAAAVASASFAAVLTEGGAAAAVAMASPAAVLTDGGAAAAFALASSAAVLRPIFQNFPDLFSFSAPHEHQQ